MTHLNCPNCSKNYVTRVARVGFAEKLLSVFYIYPFRCQLCGWRFKILQWGVRYLRVEEDRREYDRLRTKFPLSFIADGFQGEGLAADLSMSGCTFQTQTNLPREGGVIEMALQIADGMEPVKVDAVIRNVRNNLVGVEFLRFQEAEKFRLQHYVRELLARQRETTTGAEYQVGGSAAVADLQRT